MNVILKKDARDVLSAQITYFPYHINVKNVQVIAPDLLPAELCSDGNINSLLILYLQSRCFQPWQFEHDNFDDMMIQMLNAKWEMCGRMNGAELTIGAISYFASSQDDYFLTPVHIEHICHLYTAPELPSIWMIPPVDNRKECQQAIEYRKIKLPT